MYTGASLGSVTSNKIGYMKDSPLATVILPRIEKLHIKFLEDMAQVEFLKEIKGTPMNLFST